MILKRQMNDDISEHGVWEFIDKIDSVQTYTTRETGEGGQPDTLHRWAYYDRGGVTVTLALPGAAYLLSDSGKTIERI